MSDSKTRVTADGWSFDIVSVMEAMTNNFEYIVILLFFGLFYVALRPNGFASVYLQHRYKMKELETRQGETLARVIEAAKPKFAQVEADEQEPTLEFEFKERDDE